jgi:hypothetical protein
MRCNAGKVGRSCRQNGEFSSQKDSDNASTEQQRYLPRRGLTLRVNVLPHPGNPQRSCPPRGSFEFSAGLTDDDDESLGNVSMQ